MSRRMPGESASEIEKGERFQISDRGRDYREVNRNNNDGGGMNKLRREDYGRGSRERSSERRR